MICAVDVAGSTPTEYEVVRVYREGTQGEIEVQVTHQGMLAALQPTLFVIEVAREDLADSYTLERC